MYCTTIVNNPNQINTKSRVLQIENAHTTHFVLALDATQQNCVQNWITTTEARFQTLPGDKLEEVRCHNCAVGVAMLVLLKVASMVASAAGVAICGVCGRVGIKAAALVLLFNVVGVFDCAQIF